MATYKVKATGTHGFALDTIVHDTAEPELTWFGRTWQLVSTLPEAHAATRTDAHWEYGETAYVPTDNLEAVL